MKTNRKVSLATIATAAVVLNFSSCKYEDGPNFTLRSKKGRLVCEWSAKVWADQILDDDVVLNLEFEDDNDVKIHIEYSYTYYGQTYEYSYDALGSWKWTDKKEGIILDMDGDIYDFTILRLTSKELNMEDSDGDKYELEAID